MAKLKSVLEKFQQVKQAIEQENKKSSFNNELIFKPQIAKGEEKAKFKLRFLPVEESATGKPWVQINCHMFERAGDNKYIKVIDPRTFDPKAQNPIADLASKLFKSENALDQAMAKKLYRKPRYYTLVYVKEAPESQKHYEGKVLIFEAGVKVFGKLEVAMKDYEMCFWDPYKGRDFMLIMKTVGKEQWPNYDDSSFIGADGPISTDEKVMDAIGDALEKIKIKEVIVGKEGIKSGAQLKELLEGGLNAQPKVNEEPAQDLVSGKTVSTTASELDFGDVKKEEKSAPVAKAEAPKPESKESGSDVNGDFEISFSDDDFNIK